MRKEIGRRLPPKQGEACMTGWILKALVGSFCEHSAILASLKRGGNSRGYTHKKYSDLNTTKGHGENFAAII